MNVQERIRMCNLLIEMKKNEQLAKQVGLKDASVIKNFHKKKEKKICLNILKGKTQ